MNDASAQRAGLLTARALLDDALVCLHRLGDPRLPIAALEHHLGGALDKTYQALDAPGDPERYQALCREALEHAREALFFFQDRELRNPDLAEPLGLVAQTIGALIEAARTPYHVTRLTPERAVDAAWLPASFDEPRRVDVDRAVLQVVALILKPDREPIEIEPVEVEPEVDDAAPVPAVDLDALLAEAESAGDDDEADDAAAPPPPADAPATEVPATEVPTEASDAADEALIFGEALTAQAVLLKHARGFFEDLSMMGLMRRPDAGDVWYEMLPIEQRLLARVDAILAAGTWVLADVVGTLADRPLPEPDLTWGALFLYGSLGGADALDQVVRLVRMVPLDDAAVFDAVADALSFAPNEGLEVRLRPWLRDADPGFQRVALHVLSRRRALASHEVIDALSSPHVPVVAEAARALSLTQGPIDPGVLSWIMRHPDPAVLSAALMASLIHDRAGGVAHAVAITTGGFGHYGDAALVVALGGGARDMDALRTAMVGDGSVVLTEALGWSGLVDAVPYLLDRLEAGELEALTALQRITGASLTEDHPAHDPDDPLPFTRDDTMPEAELVLLEDHVAWRSWWHDHGRRPQPGERWMHGHRWTLRDALWELTHNASSPRERTLAWYELVARTGGKIPFDARDWVVRQQRLMAAWTDYVGVRNPNVTPGAWPVGGYR